MRTNIRNVRLRRISRLKPLLQCIAVIEITGFVGGASAPMAAGPFCFSRVNPFLKCISVLCKAYQYP